MLPGCSRLLAYAFTLAASSPDAAARAEDFVIPGGVEGERIPALLAPHEIGGGEDAPRVHAVDVQQREVLVHLRGPGDQRCLVRLRHPSRAGPGDRSLPSFAVALEPPDCALALAARVLEALETNDDGAFPWKSLKPEPPRAEATDDARETEGEEPQPQPQPPPQPQQYKALPWHEPPSSRQIRRVRAWGTPGWMAIMAGLVFVIAALSRAASWLRRRLQPGAGDPREGVARGGLTSRARVVLALLGLALWIGFSALMNAAVHHLLPAPVVRRGVAPRVPAPPPAGAVGLYAYGASTMAGEPYYGRLSITEVVRYSLSGRLGDAPLHVENLGVGGTSFEMIAPISLYTALDDPDRYRPRVVLLYLGHNEHWTLSRDVRRAGGLSDALLERERARVEARYEATLRELAGKARDAGAVLIVALPVGNLEGAPPQRSRHGDDVPKDARARCEALVRAASEQLERGDAESLAAALSGLDEAAQLSPGYALTYYLRSRAQRARGDAGAARADAWRAVTRDVKRERAMPSQNAIVRRICDEGLARCVDAEAELRARFDAIDDRLFVDLHHPRAPAVLILGQAFAREIADAYELPAPAPIDPRRPPAPLDVSDLEFQTELHTASWFVRYELGSEHEFDDYARADAARRVRASLARARAIAPDDHDARARHAFLEAVMAALDGDEARARAKLEEAKAPPRSDWITRALDNPNYRPALSRVLDGG